MIHHGDCLDVMAAMEPESIDAIVTDPPYGIGFMGKAWDDLDVGPVEKSWSSKGRNTSVESGNYGISGLGYAPPNPRCGNCGRTINGRDTAKGFKVCHCEEPTYAPTVNRSAQRSQAWHQQWAEAAYRVAKPSAYLLAFGGTRTVHRMTVALEDAGWIIRDMLVWGYASGFPKSKASLKPAWEPIVMARKPGPLRMLAIDECRIGTGGDKGESLGRWPANIVLTDAIFDGGIEGVVGGGETMRSGLTASRGRSDGAIYGGGDGYNVAEVGQFTNFGDTGTYSRFFLIPKAARSDREPVLGGLPETGLPIGAPGATTECANCGSRRLGDGGVHICRPGCIHKDLRMVPSPTRQARANVHPTVKPTDLMRHLVRLVTPAGGVVLDPFLGSGTTGLAAEMEGFGWIGIEREAEYVAIAEARLNGTQKGLGI